MYQLLAATKGSATGETIPQLGARQRRNGYGYIVPPRTVDSPVTSSSDSDSEAERTASSWSSGTTTKRRRRKDRTAPASKAKASVDESHALGSVVVQPDTAVEFVECDPAPASGGVYRDPGGVFPPETLTETLTRPVHPPLINDRNSSTQR